MKLEENMYVRTNAGRFYKIKNTDFYIERYVESYDNDLILKKSIKKASHNIIDLIEAGDYVNGYLIMSITDVKNKDVKCFEVFRMNGTSRIKMWEEEDIKSIVTKEQFSQMEYRVGE